MSTPTKQQSIVYQVSMYSSLVHGQTGPNLEAALYADIVAALQKDAPRIGNWSVAWGPVVTQFNTTSYAVNAMYVAESNDTPGTYVVGIAGTNPSSRFDWLVEDGLVATQLPWIYAARSAPGARISLGTGIGLAILQNAAPGSGIPGTGTTLREFLAGLGNKKGANVIVSGHSLGGALSPTLTLWLHDTRLLWDPFHEVTLSTMPTAGPTAGNSQFAAYSDQAIAITRFANAIDVVPHAWQLSDLAKISTLYVPAIEPDDAIYGLVSLAERLSSGGDYTQLVRDTGWFPSKVNEWIISAGKSAFVNFLVQLAYQHTVAYLKFFGVVSEALETWAAQFQVEAAAAAPSVVAGFAAAAACRQATAPVGGRPAVIPSGSDPAAAEVAARVLAELARNATPEQQQFAVPFDRASLAASPAAAGNS